MTLRGCTLDRHVSKHVRLNYLLHLPDSYERDVDRRWPLLLFLHGAGERGDDLEQIKLHGLPRLLVDQPGFPFIVVAPQCPAHSTWSLHLDALIALLDEISATYRVDQDRVSVTGLSMGGAGTWQLGVMFPDRFAALAPICGGGGWYIAAPADQMRKIRHIPTWVFHGALDTIVPLLESARLVAALRECGGDVRFTVYEDAAHNSWNQAYATAELYEWLQKQSVKRNRRTNAQP